ncbi:MAG TPA: ATP-binding protein [Armatimonadota bacterium]|nr:ATP-binding protein [Armatimonadota bacterium]
MTGNGDIQCRLISKPGQSAGSENTNRIMKRESHLWLFAIFVILAIALVVDLMDLYLALDCGAGLDGASHNWTPAFIRVMLLCVVGGGTVYYFKTVSKLLADNHLLIQDLNLQAKLLAEKHAQLVRLKQLSEALISQVDLKHALDLALEMATVVIGARTASIMLLDPNGEELYIAAARGLSEDIVKNAKVKIGEGLAGMVAKEGEALVINSDDLNERLAPYARRKHEIKSAIIAPIKIDGQVRGVINMSDKNGSEKWQDEDLSVVSTLAGQAAMVLQKIELYGNLQEQVAMLQDTLQELQKTQAGLIQSEKLASIGQLAGGVAHEINNPLMVILGRAEFALEKLESGESVERDLEVIRTQTERIAEIVRNLLSFARVNRIDDLRPVAINDIIERTLALTELQMAKHNIKVARDLGTDLPPVWGNPGQLQQVMVNLVINSYQAMASVGNGGILTVSTCEEEGQVVVRFKDTGPGIKPEDAEQIFEPFYTTKSETEGTGLGLAISRGIIHTHGGRISAGNGEDKGAVFTIELPALDPKNLPGEDDISDEHETNNGRGRRERDSGVVS